MKKKKTGKSAMDSALDYLTSRPRTVREMENYLDGQNYGEYEVYAAVERLKELKYLDDVRYAADFVSTRLATKPLSRRKLKEQLRTHYLSDGTPWPWRRSFTVSSRDLRNTTEGKEL